ncbi:unnamed protein product [Sphenostylis stenocarpa]|uniref:Uncharacterized protein n=1 Tax=Sphenostylis stenocarpa TaxID=92480 RepID=A0AA86SEW8_9FABA|nr:unnamed protein product [Sphenostylis stenocarpa]
MADQLISLTWSVQDFQRLACPVGLSMRHTHSEIGFSLENNLNEAASDEALHKNKSRMTYLPSP